MKLRSGAPNSRRVRGGLTSLVVATVALLALAVPSPARADTVTEWNLNASSALFDGPASGCLLYVLSEWCSC
jgi:hypothetical protein